MSFTSETHQSVRCLKEELLALRATRTPIFLHSIWRAHQKTSLSGRLLRSWQIESKWMRFMVGINFMHLLSSLAASLFIEWERGHHQYQPPILLCSLCCSNLFFLCLCFPCLPSSVTPTLSILKVLQFALVDSESQLLVYSFNLNCD